MPAPTVTNATRSRAFCFTTNNPSDEDYECLEGLDCKFVIFGHETAPSTGTEHLQGYVYFKNPISFKSCKTRLPAGSHIEIAHGTPEQNITYCSKGGDVIEHGERPLSATEKGDSERARWDEIYNLAIEERYSELPRDVLVRYHRGLRSLRGLHYHQRVSEPLPDIRNMWFSGKPGVGKSRSARAWAEQNHMRVYVKTMNNWWDGYNYEEVVLIDDLDRDHNKLAYLLKLWGDRYPFQAEVKGGMMYIRPRHIIVTSNYKPDEIWSHSCDLDPIVRRYAQYDFDLPVNRLHAMATESLGGALSSDAVLESDVEASDHTTELGDSQAEGEGLARCDTPVPDTGLSNVESS